MSKITYWKDFDNNFTRKSGGDVNTMSNIEAIYNSLTNIFETLKGGRRMLPEFALPLHNILFEPIDDMTSQELGEMILAAVHLWETRIEVDNVNVIGRPDRNYYEINLEVRIVNDPSSDTTEVFTSVLRTT